MTFMESNAVLWLRAELHLLTTNGPLHREHIGLRTSYVIEELRAVLSIVCVLLVTSCTHCDACV